MNDKRDAPDIHTALPPVIAEQEVKEREENERVDVEIYSSPSRYMPPPYSEAEQEANINEDSVIRELFEDKVIEMTPPLPFEHIQSLNVILERLKEVDIDLNSLQ